MKNHYKTHKLNEILVRTMIKEINGGRWLTMGELVKGKIVGGCCGGGRPRWGVGGTRGQPAAVRATRSPSRCWEQATEPTAARGCSWGGRGALLWWLLVRE